MRTFLTEVFRTNQALAAAIAAWATWCLSRNDSAAHMYRKIICVLENLVQPAEAVALSSNQPLPAADEVGFHGVQ